MKMTTISVTVAVTEVVFASPAEKTTVLLESLRDTLLDTLFMYSWRQFLPFSEIETNFSGSFFVFFKMKS